MAVTFLLGRAFLPALAEAFEVLGPQRNGHVHTEKKEGPQGSYLGCGGCHAPLVLTGGIWGPGLGWVSVRQEVYMKEKQIVHVSQDRIFMKRNHCLPWIWASLVQQASSAP